MSNQRNKEKIISLPRVNLLIVHMSLRVCSSMCAVLKADLEELWEPIVDKQCLL